MLSSGAIVHDRYRITRAIGRGGMGAVYEAVDSRLQNVVAVKQMTVESPEADRAFEHEAMLLAALRHPALPVVIDYFTDAGDRFLVMQFIEGEDLARTLERRGGACDPDEVLAWARAVLEALRYLHERRPPIVHRDIKPANLKRTPTGEIVLLDFGLAKGRHATRSGAAGDLSIPGYTVRYAPPEQIEWRGTDSRSDVYALGATLFHLLTGTPPPPAPARLAAARDGRGDPLPDPCAINSRVGAALGRVVVQALALEPSARFESAAAMLAALPGIGVESVARRCASRNVPTPRRVDAAMPSRAEVGRQTDLLVQVRFAGSPVLGLEDWPSRRRPASIEQVSERVHVVHPADPETGELLPARLRVRVVAPDFVLQGQSDLIINVPADDYSKRLAFLLTPTRPGYCRVNVEVHGPDAVFLGAVPIETEAVASAVDERMLQVATLALGVHAHEAQQVPGVVRPETTATASPQADDDDATVPMAGPPRPGPADSTGDDSTAVRLPPAASPRRGGLRRLMMASPLAAAAVIAGVFVWNQQFGTPLPGVPPAAAPPPDTVAASPAPPADWSPGETSAPAPAPPQPPREVPESPRSPRPPRTVASRTHAGVELSRVDLALATPGRVRLLAVVTNRSASPVRVAFDYGPTHLARAGTRARVTADSAGTAPTGVFSMTLGAGQARSHWVEFEVIDRRARSFDVVLAAPSSERDAVRFPSFAVVVADRSR